ncbi:conserved protein of unknown function (plasmid) [Rhodovastum atsumiense]|uniref:hypothetical protein n=1 Tax=Rhodovastum atsumiense TaxID=504468 RepID=UPI00193BD5C1|nr:hypothetical protein [Rhodovastum atsumiense]CAH2606316.1 conserved protein of unknown function [Rhodovastum atsumiense]
MSNRKLEAAISQGSLFDLLAAQAPQASRRLLILQCGKSKNPAEGKIPARDRYTGPLWTTLRNADPNGERTQVAALSAKYGLIRGSREIDNYDLEMTDRIAEQMLFGGGSALYPVAEPCKAKTEAGRDRYRAKLAAMGRTSPFREIVLTERAAGAPLTEICIVGGHRYCRVAEALLAEFRLMGILSPSCKITIINDEIGMMRKRMKEWIAA